MAKLFISYSHQDEGIKEKIEDHLSVLIRNNTLSIWQDRLLEAGSEFDERIKIKLEDADIILLLISSNFFKSDYCYIKEMPRALEKHNKGEAVVIPIIVNSYKWKETKLGKLVALPKDAKPIKKHGNRDDAYSYISEKIKEVALRVNNHSHTVNRLLNKYQKNAHATRSLYSNLKEELKFYSNLAKGFAVLGVIGFFIIKLSTTDLPDLEPVQYEEYLEYSIPYVLKDKYSEANFRSDRSKNNRNIIRIINKNEVFYSHQQPGERWWSVKTSDGTYGYLHSATIRRY